MNLSGTALSLLRIWATMLDHLRAGSDYRRVDPEPQTYTFQYYQVFFFGVVLYDGTALDIEIQQRQQDSHD